MFDRIIVSRPKTEYVPYEKTIVEKKAPTEESIRLLNEMQTEARKNIVKSITVEDNTFKYHISLFANTLTLGHTAIFKYSVNGTEYVKELPIPDSVGSSRALAGFVFDAVREELLETIGRMLAPIREFK